MPRTEYAKRMGFAPVSAAKRRRLNANETQDSGVRKKPASTKNKIRSLQRLFSKTVEPEKRAALRRQMQELEGTRASHHQRERERKFAVRYHKIKFFERKKLQRKLKSVSKRLAVVADEGERRALTAERRRLEADVVYVDFYPKGCKYYSLFGRSQGQDDPKTEALRQRMRQRAMEAFEATGGADAKRNDEEDGEPRAEGEAARKREEAKGEAGGRHRPSENSEDSSDDDEDSRSSTGDGDDSKEDSDDSDNSDDSNDSEGAVHSSGGTAKKAAGGRKADAGETSDQAKAPKADEADDFFM